MFAVPGWSLSADKLRPEALAPAPSKASPAKADTAASTSSHAEEEKEASKKRKRPSHGPQVTSANVADLWEKLIDKVEGDKPQEETPHLSRRAKKLKRAQELREQQATTTTAAGEVPDEGLEKAPAKEKIASRADKEPVAAEPTLPPTRAEDKVATKKATKEKKKQKGKEQKEQKEKKEQKEPEEPAEPEKTEKPEKPEQKVQKEQKEPKEHKKHKEHKEHTASKKTADTSAQSQPPAALPSSAVSAPAPAPALALTPLQASMRAKLISARFRHLNETLYTRPSAEALRLFSESPDMFLAYHEGFRQQVAVWPENPVDTYVAEVRRRAGRGGSKHNSSRGGPRPGDTLPRTRGTCRIADVGCGDARMAASLAPLAQRLRVQVLSYDLHADPANPHITAAADAAELPLQPASADVVVFCLALMGTNWLAFVEEAYRVLRWKGELWVAEIKSRFAGAAELRAGLKKQKGTPVKHSVGYRRKNGIKGGKDKKADEEDPDVVAAATAEIDGWDEGNAGGGLSTDVSAFVHALARRGFVLDGNSSESSGGEGGKPAAVDLSNKMFVKMRFLKAAPATVGKEAVAHGTEAAKKKIKFLDNDGSDKPADAMDDPAVEAKILKPCVYKLR